MSRHMPATVFFIELPTDRFELPLLVERPPDPNLPNREGAAPESSRVQVEPSNNPPSRSLLPCRSVFLVKIDARRFGV